MIDLISGFLTLVLVLNCFLLGLLILVQLPKKEAGAGIAFGGGAADALFGAGSGNALTKMTKYAAGIFLGLAMFLSMLSGHRANRDIRGLDESLKAKAGPAAVIPNLATNAAAGPANTNLLMTTSNSLPRSSTP